MSRARLLAAALLGLIASFALLLDFAGVRADTPLRPALEREWPLAFTSSTQAQLINEPGGLKVIGNPAEGMVMISAELAPFAASELRFFDIELAQTSTLLRGLLIWRSEGQIHNVALPGHVAGTHTLDLATVPGWSGQVDLLGLVLLPTDYLAAERAPPRDSVLHSARLSSDGWGPRLRALWTQWTAYRPWNGRSNHTAGYELSASAGPSLTAFVAALLLLALVLGALAWGWAGAGRAAQRVALAALLLLAGWQTTQLALRAGVAMEARAALGDDHSAPLAALPALAQDALELQAVLQPLQPPRLMVWGGNGFYREYPTWLLRRFNAGSLRMPEDLQRAASQRPDALLVMAGSEGWNFDAATGLLTAAPSVVAAEPLFAGRLLQLFRIRPAETAP